MASSTGSSGDGRDRSGDRSRGQSGRGGKAGNGGRGKGGRGQGGKGSGDRGQGGQGPRGQGKGRPPEEEEGTRLARSLEKVLERIPETQAAVLRYRMGLVDGQPHSTADTARKLGLSLSETREIEARAFEHIREAVPVEHLQKYLRA